jgi:D-tyrosyl-tRNA(Tyr) deacylase
MKPCALARDLSSFIIQPSSFPMRSVIQRVSSAGVTIAGLERARIGAGLLVLLGIEEADTAEDIEWLSGKIVRLRVFNDDEGVMNRSVQEVGGGILVVSQFTLHASTKKGNRPSYLRAARPEVAVPLYEQFLRRLEMDFCAPVQRGEFGADMQVALVNDGPVTIVIDTKSRE